jgi:hypothetical protein
MSTLTPKKIEGTKEEVRKLLIDDFKRMVFPFFASWGIFYFLFIGFSVYGFQCLGERLHHYYLLLLIGWDIFSFFAVGLFHHLHFFASEAIENGERTTIGIFIHFFKNLKNIKPIQQKHLRWVLFITFFDTIIELSFNHPSYLTALNIYGSIIVFWKGNCTLPYVDLASWIKVRIASGDESISLQLEKDAVILNKELLLKIVIFWRMILGFIGLMIPIFAVLIEPFCVLMGYVFYKHVFDDGLKMKQKSKVKNGITLLKPKIAFSTN